MTTINNTDSLTIDKIPSKLKAGEIFLKEKHGKSGVWDKFAELVDSSHKKIGFAICKDCDHILKYNYKTGTSNLQRHNCRDSNNQSKITSFLQKNKPPANVKELTKKKLIDFVCNDLRPFEIVSGKGFRDFIQEMINIGSIHGSFPVDELLPNPTTISRNIIKAAESIKSNLTVKLIEVFRKVGGAFTTDCWTDDYRKISYISLTVHYIEDWNLKDQVLAVSKFSDTNHTAENIKKNIFGILRKYHLSEINMRRYIFVTDSASNFVAALRSYGHLPCISHR